jgi:DNA repair protein RadC
LTAARTGISDSVGKPADGNMLEKVDMKTLYVRDDSGYHQAEAHVVIAHAQTLIRRRYRVGNPVMSSPERTREYLRLNFGALDHEIFGCLWLNNRNKLITVEELFRGSIDAAAVYPREVVKAALRHSAAACVIFHNHVSGASEPSAADEAITTRLREALTLIGVRLVDHLIIADPIYSFAESGRL